MARSLELGGLPADAAPIEALAPVLDRSTDALRALRRTRTMADRGDRLLVADDNKVNRLLLGAQLGAAGPPGGQRRERPRRAGDAAPGALRPAAAGHGDARARRLRRARAAGRRPRAARPAGHRDQFARGRGARRALHRAGRRRLPAEAGESGAAEGAHELQPGEEAPARPAEGADPALRHHRGGPGPRTIRLRAGRPARARRR